MDAVDWMQVVRLLAGDQYLDLDEVVEISFHPDFQDYSRFYDWRTHSDSFKKFDLGKRNSRERCEMMNQHFLARPLPERIFEIIICHQKADAEEWD